MFMELLFIVELFGAIRAAGAAGLLAGPRGGDGAAGVGEGAHHAGFSLQDVIVGPPDWNTVYSLPAVPGVLPVREMNVQFYDVGGGATVIMADAMVQWQPPRSASEVIPASVSVVTIAGFGPPRGNPVPVTITSVPVVRQLAALVNGLPVSTVGDALCPGGGVALTLTFGPSRRDAGSGSRAPGIAPVPATGMACAAVAADDLTYWCS